MEEKDSEFVGIDIGARYIHVAQSKLTADGGRRIVDNFYDPQLNENVRNIFDVNKNDIETCSSAKSYRPPKNVVCGVKYLIGKDKMEDVCKECVGMDFDAKEIILNNERRLKIGMKYNQSSIFYFFPEFIQSEIINHCLEIISNEDHIPTLNPRHISFSIPLYWSPKEISNFRVALRCSNCENSHLVPDHIAAANSLCSFLYDYGTSPSAKYILSIGHSYTFACKCEVSTYNEFGTAQVKGSRSMVCRVTDCVYTTALSGASVERDLYAYLLEVMPPFLKKQFMNSDRVRFSLIRFLESVKCDFCAHSGELTEVDLEKLDGIRGSDFLEDVSSDVFYDLCVTKYQEIISTVLNNVMKGQVGEVYLIGGGAIPAFVEDCIQKEFQNRGIQLMKCLNVNTAISHGLVMDNLTRLRRANEQFVVLDDAPVRCLDTGVVQYMDCQRHVENNEWLYEAIQKDKEMWEQEAASVKKRRDTNMMEYRRLCSEREQLITGPNRVVDPEHVAYFRLYNRVSSMPKYSQREQYLEQQLQSLRDSQEEFKTIQEKDGRGVITFPFDFHV